MTKKRAIRRNRSDYLYCSNAQLPTCLDCCVCFNTCFSIELKSSSNPDPLLSILSNFSISSTIWQIGPQFSYISLKQAVPTSYSVYVWKAEVSLYWCIYLLTRYRLKAPFLNKSRIVKQALFPDPPFSALPLSRTSCIPRKPLLHEPFLLLWENGCKVLIGNETSRVLYKSRCRMSSY